jgi:8-oxo-dGTP pyrophosphatase MutT (NUDIX family)
VSFEPQKFFLGVVDFFSVLLPGALLTYVLRDYAGPRLLGPGYQSLAGVEAGAVFLFSAYLLGHFIFLLGSWALDDRVYDKIRRATDQSEIERLAAGKSRSPALVRWLARRLFKQDVDQAVRLAVRIKRHYLDPLNASATVNAFQWSKARLTLAHPDAIASVHRFEADSKFFRSFTVVLFALALWGLFTAHVAIAVVGVPLLVLAFWRYVDQRQKATNQAYWYIITLESQSEGNYRKALQAAPAGPSHAGGVVFRTTVDGVEYLLVQAKRPPHEWVLPKGHIEPGEPAPGAAVREVREETGVWARIRNDLQDSAYSVNGVPVKVRFYLMEALAEEAPDDTGRRHEWLPLAQALGQAYHPESQRLLEMAEQMRATV